MDVTDKVSIQKAKEYIEEKEGRVHILVNKSVGRVSHFGSLINMLSDNTFLAVPVKWDPFRPSLGTPLHLNGRTLKPLELRCSTTRASKHGLAFMLSTLRPYSL